MLPDGISTAYLNKPHYDFLIDRMTAPVNTSHGEKRLYDRIATWAQ